ncbi:MAG TPA: hypothetical protein VML35_01090 [Gaiellaceae bacterium]|nr:hypothetical protein [Gaiellaceae bacterium]
MRRVAAAACALGLLVAGCGGEEATAPPPGKALATSRSLTPAAHLFADPVSARLDVVVDREQLDPDLVRIRVDFLPYRMVSGLERSRHDFSRFTRLRYEAKLRCLTVACVPTRLGSVLGDQEGRGERRTFRFEPVRVIYDDPNTGRPRQLKRVWWPPVDGISRLSPDVSPIPFGMSAGAEFHATLAPVLEPEYRLPPPLLAALLLAGAAALLALPATLVVRAVRRRRPLDEGEPRVPPLERALRLVERARDGGDAEEQRKALEALAYELDAAEDARVTEVRELAWSPAPPSRERVTALVESVRGPDVAAV